VTVVVICLLLATSCGSGILERTKNLQLQSYDIDFRSVIPIIFFQENQCGGFVHQRPADLVPHHRMQTNSARESTITAIFIASHSNANCFVTHSGRYPMFEMNEAGDG